jgi:hypothetical protein
MARLRFTPIFFVLTLTTVFFIAMKGNRIVITLFAVDLGAGPFQTGLLFALHGIFPLLLAVSAGRVADRFDNRLLMYWGISCYAFANLLPFFWPGLVALYVCAAIGGFTSKLLRHRRILHPDTRPGDGGLRHRPLDAPARLPAAGRGEPDHPGADLVGPRPAAAHPTQVRR